MSLPKLYRKRFIPLETIELKNDILIYQNENILITKWKVFRPKAAFSHGVSCYFLKEGYKISKFLDDANNLVYYYCDIIETTINEKENSYLFTDLLVDVMIYPDGFVKVVDLAELADAREEGLITEEIVKMALRQLEKLLEIIYDGKLFVLTKHLEIEG